MGEPGGELRFCWYLCPVHYNNVQSSFSGLPEKYCITFGFRSYFHLCCLDDHTYRHSMKMINKNLSTLYQCQCQQNCKREVQGPKSWPNSGKPKIPQVAWRERWWSKWWPLAPGSCMWCGIQSNRQMILSFFSATTLFHWHPTCKSKNRRTWTSWWSSG